MIAIGVAWIVLATAVHLLALRFWPTHRYGLRALTMATLLAPGVIGLDMFAPLPASIAAAFWITQLPGTEAEVVWHAASWLLAMTVFYVAGRVIYGSRIQRLRSGS